MMNNNYSKCNVSRETLFHLYKVTIVLFIIITFVSPNMLAISTVPGLTTNNYLIIEKNSEVILAGENYDEPAGIASVTKLMSYYVYMDKITSDDVDIDNTIIPVSDQIVDVFASDPGLSGVYFDYGDEYPLPQMFDLMLVYSDNGATKAIGEYLYGTEELAVEAMNSKAKQLGMENTVYYNTTGLTMSDYKEAKLKGTKSSDYNISTAREQLIMVKSLLSDYPQVLDIVGKSFVEFDGYTLPSFNLMLPELDYDYPGVIGMKTGSSNEAGYCFLGYYINPITNKEYLSIVLGSESTTKRFNDTTYLYNWLDEVEMDTLMLENEELSLPIKGATKPIYQVKTNSNYELPQSSASYNLERNEFQYNTKYFDGNNKLIKDIPEGEVVGSFVFKLAEDEVSENVFESLNSEPNSIKFQVVSTEVIKKEGIIGSVITGISNFYVNVFESM